MLSFSANTRPQTQAPPQKQFQYFVISNDPPPVKHNPTRVPNPSHKSIVKTHNSKPKPTQKPSSASLNRTQEKEFSHKITQPKMFDQRLKRGELAAEQRRIQNQLRKMNKQIRTEHEYQHIPAKVVNDVASSQQNRVNSMKNKSMEKEQKQMEHLQQLIEKEKREIKKNNREFEQKEKAFGEQFKRLKMIENHLKKGKNPNNTLMMAENSINMGNINKPSYYRHPQTSKQPINKNTEHYIDGQQERERKKKELAQLMGRRQKLQKYQNPLKYAPTLIPLLSKASYRIISTHISGITELLIDDILLEQVLILEEIEEKEKEEQEKRRQRRMLEDYVSQVGEMVRENDLIENRIGNYNKLDFFEWHQPQKSYAVQDAKKEREYELFDTITMYLTNEMKTAIFKNKDKFEKFTKYRDEYGKANLQMFSEATEELIGEMVDGLVRELDKGSSEFVETIFKHQFK